jgi:dolichyl-phosphate-mannose--protein O-mannosyl transferase
MKKINIIFLILIFLFSLFFHFYRLSFPSKVVFDEQWYASHAASYFANKYYFDVHPPLAKLLIAFFGYLFGFKDPTGRYYFRHATEYPSLNSYLPFRILPAFLGALLPILGWFFVKGLNGSDMAAFLASAFLLFDNALLTQSRFVLIEIIVVFFSFLSALFYVYFLKQKTFSKKWFIFLFFMGISLGFAISSKWSAFVILATIIFLEILRFFKSKKQNEKLLYFLKRKKKEVLILLVFILILPSLIYLFSFYLHFSLIKTPRNISDFSDPLLYSKKEDLTRTPSPHFYQLLSGNFLRKFLKTQKMMLSVLAVTADHPYKSFWWQWPLGRKPMLYFQEKEKSIYLVPNPLIWYLSFFAAIFVFYIPYFKLKYKKKAPYFFKNPIILYLYYVSWLFYLPIQRTSFLYYYLLPLSFSIVIFSLVFDFLTQNTPSKKRKIIFTLLISFAFVFFVSYLPFVYGFSLTGKLSIFKKLIFPFWR